MIDLATILVKDLDSIDDYAAYELDRLNASDR